jgi:hypothetical protein
MDDRLRLPASAALAATLFLGALGCGGSRVTGDRAGSTTSPLRITPDAPAVVQGQTLQFQAAPPWGGELRWTVLPASAGTLNQDGLFTAGNNLGTFTILAVWSKDVRYTAGTTVTVVVPPLPATSTPALVSASGSHQASADGKFTNAAVAGEDIPALTSKSINQVFQVRHGFLPAPTPVN